MLFILDADQSSLSSVTPSRIRHRSNTINERFSAVRQRLNYETSHASLNLTESTQSRHNSDERLTSSRTSFAVPSEIRLFLTSTPLPNNHTENRFQRFSNDSLSDVSNLTSQ